MKRTLLYLLFMCLGSVGLAQTLNMDSIFEPKLCGEIFNPKKGIEGKQFYNDEWQMSDIKLSSGEMVFNKQLKYNILMDEVIWLQPDGFRQVKLEKHFIDEFCFRNYNGNPVRFKRIKAKLPKMTDSLDIFAEVLVEKAASLYIYHHFRIEGTVNNIDGALYYMDKLQPSPFYIIRLPDRQEITFTGISRRVLNRALPVKYKEIFKQIIQEYHLSVQTENDLARLVGMVAY